MAKLIAYECEDTDHGSCRTATTAAAAAAPSEKLCKGPAADQHGERRRAFYQPPLFWL